MATCTITGTILDASGKGVAGVVVTLTPESPSIDGAEAIGGVGIVLAPVAVASNDTLLSGQGIVSEVATTLVVVVGAQYDGLTVDAEITAQSGGSASTEVLSAVVSGGTLTVTLDAAPGAGETTTVDWGIGKGDFAIDSVQGFRYRLDIEAIGYSRDFESPPIDTVRFDLIGIVPTLETITDHENEDADIELTFTITVGQISTVRERFDVIQLEESSTGQDGPFVLLTTLILEDEVDVYNFEQVPGDPAHYFRARYFNSDNSDAGQYTEPKIGDSAEAALVFTPEELIDIYLFGVDLTDDDGNPYPTRLFEFYIDAAVDWLEEELDMYVVARNIVDETQDHFAVDYARWGYFQLQHQPVSRIDKLSFQYPSMTEEVVIDAEWLVLQEVNHKGYSHTAQLQVVPGRGNIADVLLIPGSLMPIWSGATGRVPGVWHLDYRAGFEPEDIPTNLRNIIGMAAAIGVLNIAGDLIAGAGIANLSTSIPGLSQTLGTTSSATNSGYGARIIAYKAEIKEKLKQAKLTYRGIRMTVA